MNETLVSGLIVQPIAEHIRAWNLEGKISEQDLDDALTYEGRALVDHTLALADWVPVEDVEGLVGLAVEQVGGETGIVEWAEEIVRGWENEAAVETLLRAGRSLVDAPGFVVSQVSALVLNSADWVYEGGDTSFSVRLSGLDDVSPALKALMGAIFARLAEIPTDRDFDVRFDEIDGGDLVVFGEVCDDDGLGRSRLHRAALIA